MNTLIMGGGSGLGLELGMLLKKNYKVFVTGRKNTPQDTELHFMLFTVDHSDKFFRQIEKIISQVKPIDLFIYAVGFYQNGTITDLNGHNIQQTINTGIIAPAIFLQKILQKQKQLKGFIAISSTSGQTPRLREPIYAASKAGLNMLADSIALDKRVAKTLLVSPAGMDTNFWRGKKRKGRLLDPKWVAEKIIKEFQKKFSYKHMLILREPPRVKILEKRL